MDPLTWHAAGLAVVGSIGATVLATRLVFGELQRRAILDRPNERSSHAVPTPRGGGWGVTPVVLLGWGLLGYFLPADAAVPAVLGAAACLALVCWWDDLRGLSAAPRLAVQALAVAAGVAALPSEAPVFQGVLPPALDRVAAGLAWLWFVNLFNFMDGIDGITGTELASIGGGLALIAAVTGTVPDLALYALVLAGAGLGFLVWNWHPARVFLGDIGSVPLGYLTGWLLLTAAAAGLWLPALILPLYYLTDATWTLLRRLLRGEKVWRAHREHFYQRAVRNGLTHAQVVRRILAVNLVLIACALAGTATAMGAWALVPAAGAVLALLHRLAPLRPAAA